MKQELDKCKEELTGIETVLNKLEGKDNVSVFEQLCSNCAELFNRFCSFDVKEMVSLGLGKEALEFLYRFKEYIVRLSKYKQSLIAYKEMQMNNSINQVKEEMNNVNAQMPDNVIPINQDTNNKKLELTSDIGNAA